jgi:hypothetical protein
VYASRERNGAEGPSMRDILDPPNRPIKLPRPAASTRAGIAALFWGLTILGSIIGGVTFFWEMATATGAPQQAAAAMGIAWAVLPYCCARAVSEIGKG